MIQEGEENDRVGNLLNYTNWHTNWIQQTDPES